MKRLVIYFIFIFLYLNVRSQNIIYNSLDFRYNPYVEMCCDELDITNATIYLLTTDKDVEAYVQKSFAYIIYINLDNVKNIHRAISHELFHVSQDIKGEWDLSKPTVIIDTYGCRYASKEAMRVEIKANKQSEIIKWKVLKKLRRKRNIK